MKKATQPFARKSEISEHVPMKWRRRVRVKAMQSSRAKRVFHDDVSTIEKDLSEIFDIPHPEKSQPYREPWQLFGEVRDARRIGTKQSASLESLSSCIPGILVIDPLLRQAVEKRGMHASDSAIWFLTVALREYMKSILKGSIFYSKAMDTGEIHPQILRYPNVLALNSKKDAKPRSETALPSLRDGKKTLINALDVYSASRSLPSAPINATGGAISRLYLEQSYHSAFCSLLPFMPGRQFKEVQNFLVDQIFDLGSATKPIPSRQTEKSATSDPAASKALANAIGSKLGVTQVNARQSTDDGDSSVGISTEKLNPQFPNHIGRSSKDEVSGSMTDEGHLKSENSSVALEISKEVGVDSKIVVDNDTRVNVDQTRPNPVAGISRGAKNLTAMMTRATDSKDESAVTSSGDASCALPVGEERNVSTTAAVPTTNCDKKTQMGGHLASVCTDKNNNPGSPSGEDATGDPSQRTQPLKSAPDHQTKLSTGTEIDKTTGSTGTGSGARGKGFGTKDLAAMLARSQTGTVVDEAAVVDNATGS
jgi:hypothetical protein